MIVIEFVDGMVLINLSIEIDSLMDVLDDLQLGHTNFDALVAFYDQFGVKMNAPMLF